MRFYKLNDIVLSVRGNAAHFLSGLTSNTLEQPYNAFLSQHGRIIATFFQKRISDDEFLLAIAPITLEPLLKHLERYANLNRTQLQATDLKA